MFFISLLLHLTFHSFFICKDLAIKKEWKVKCSNREIKNIKLYRFNLFLKAKFLKYLFDVSTEPFCIHQADFLNALDKGVISLLNFLERVIIMVGYINGKVHPLIKIQVSFPAT